MTSQSTFSNCGKEENDFILNEFNTKEDYSVVVRNSYEKYTRIRHASHENTECLELCLKNSQTVIPALTLTYGRLSYYYYTTDLVPQSVYAPSSFFFLACRIGLTEMHQIDISVIAINPN